jgi:hypothetical protein
MSRGLGRWQLGLLAALEKHPAVFLAALLPRNYPRAQYVALHRAAHTLASKGKVDIWHTGMAGGTNSMWVTRPGYTRRPAPARGERFDGDAVDDEAPDWAK